MNKEKLKNKILSKEIFIIAIIIFAIAAFSFNINIAANDELWNFSNIYKMSYGEKIYQDINVIVTPLFFYIGQIFFEIFGANYLVFRIYNLILYSLLFYLIYKLFKKLGLPRTRALTYLMIIYFVICPFITLGANYNILAFIFVLIGIIYNLDEKKKKFEVVIQGLIIFLVFMSKQNIGILYMCGVIVNILIKQDELKNKIFKSLKIIGAFILFTFLYLIYIYINGSFWSFINYTVLGLFDFKENNLLFDGYIFLFIFEIIISILLIYIIVRKKNLIDKIVRNRMLILLSFSIPLLFNAYPIFNKGHIMLSSIFSIITLVYFIEGIILKDFVNNKLITKTLKIFNGGAEIVILSLSMFMDYEYIKNIQENSFDVYYGGIITNQSEIQNVTNYIQDQKQNNVQVIILSYKANLYNNILQINNGKADLPFYGNLGAEGIEGLIEEINNMENTNILIDKEEIKYQESQELRDYIMNNFERIGEIEEFYIYRKY